MAGGGGKAEPFQQILQTFAVGAGGREFHEFDASDLRRRRQRRDAGDGGKAIAHALAVEGLAGDLQGTHAVACDRTRRGAAELVVEDFDRDRSPIAAAHDGVEIGADREIALARKAAMVARQRHRVHHHGRRIGQLDDGDLARRQRGDRLDRVPQHANMERVEDDAEIGPIRHLDDLPGCGPVPDVAAPGERLVADAKAALMRLVGETAEVFGGASVVVDRFFGDVRADAEKAGAEFGHQVEFAAGALDVAGALRLGHRLEIAQRLQRDDGEAEIVGHLAHVARLAAEEGEIVLENFDGAETGTGGGGELGFQCPAHGDRGDRPLDHREFSRCVNRGPRRPLLRVLAADAKVGAARSRARSRRIVDVPGRGGSARLQCDCCEPPAETNPSTGVSTYGRTGDNGISLRGRGGHIAIRETEP